MRTLLVLAGFSFLVACGKLADEPDATGDTTIIEAPVKKPPPADTTETVKPTLTPCDPAGDTPRGSFTAGPTFRLMTQNDVLADPLPERLTELSTGSVYRSILTLAFLTPITVVTDPAFGGGRKQDSVVYQVSVSSATPLGDAFAPGVEHEATVTLYSSGTNECYQGGSGGGSATAGGEELPAKLLVTSRTATSIEGTVVVVSSQERLSFKAPLGPSYEPSANLCCFR